MVTAAHMHGQLVRTDADVDIIFHQQEHTVEDHTSAVQQKRQQSPSRVINITLCDAPR